MASRRWFAPAVGLLLLLTLAPGTPRAADWLPLDIGNRWEYLGELGGQHSQEIISAPKIHGREVLGKHYVGGPDSGLQNFWLLGADGSVLLAGFLRLDGFGLVYEPPIRFLPVPPAVEPQPPQSVTIHDYLTNAVLGTANARFDVLEIVTLVVPAGSYHSAGVGQVAVPGVSDFAPGKALALDGRTLPAVTPSIEPAEPTDWFSEGVGVVQFLSNQLYQLIGFSGPTQVAQSSWARVKRLYR